MVWPVRSSSGRICPRVILPSFDILCFRCLLSLELIWLVHFDVGSSGVFLAKTFFFSVEAMMWWGAVFSSIVAELKVLHWSYRSLQKLDLLPLVGWREKSMIWIVNKANTRHFHCLEKFLGRGKPFSFRSFTNQDSEPIDTRSELHKHQKPGDQSWTPHTEGTWLLRTRQTSTQGTFAPHI